jgi:hypothetical protein
MLPTPDASASENAERFCEVTRHIGGPLLDMTAPDPRQDHAYARQLARGHDTAAKYARAEIAVDARALAAYYRRLGATASTKRAVAIANRRYDEITARQQRFFAYVEEQCIQSQLPTVSTLAGPTAEYAVGGQGRATATYTDESGTPVTQTVELPWYVEIPASPGQSVRVSAVQEGDDIVWCTIYHRAADATLVASDAQSGDHVTATCEGTI